MIWILTEAEKMKKTKILVIASILMLSGILVGVEKAASSESLCYWTGFGTNYVNIGTNPKTTVVTHKFDLHCGVSPRLNNLEVNWEANYFRLDVLTHIESWYDPNVDPTPPSVGCYKLYGWGYGKLNGVSGYYIEFMFTDTGGLGSTDWTGIFIKDPNGKTVIEVYGFLASGDHQAYPFIKLVSKFDVNKGYAIA